MRRTTTRRRRRRRSRRCEGGFGIECVLLVKEDFYAVHKEGGLFNQKVRRRRGSTDTIRGEKLVRDRERQRMSGSS